MVQPTWRILIVENDATIAETLELILHQENYQASWILQSPDTLNAVRQHHPDLLIFDLLPNRNEDIQLLDQIRADPIAGRIPVVGLTTSEPLAESVVASYNICSTLTKPFELEEFLAR